jgi:carboxyl-terminal processing protease
MRKLSLILLGAAMGASSVGVISYAQHTFTGRANAAGPDTYRHLSLFGDIFERVRTDYVEKPNEAKLVEAAVNGLLTSLDPHSSFMDRKAHQDMQVQTRGEFGGLGIEVMLEDGNVKVVAPIDETPASRAGILSGDIITHINGEAVQGLSLNQAVDKMRGPINTEVKLRITRKSAADPIEVSLTRARILIRAVRSSMDDDIGYIRVTTFNEQVGEGVQAALKKLLADVGSDKIKGFIVDLRNNPGGLFDQAVAMTDAFLERGEIVSTRGRNPNETSRFNAKPGDFSGGKPIVVLINGGSASASEIVAGALQDHKRATLIGTRTFGKGSVQTIIPIGNQGALRLTTARYYTPSGRSIQAKGIEPDILVRQEVPPELKGRDESKGESGLRGHLQGDGQERGGSSVYVPADKTKDKQLIFAKDFILGKVTKADGDKDPAPPADVNKDKPKAE